jgi:putative transposase
MRRELQGRGHRTGLRRVERLMRDNGIRTRHKRRFKATMDSKHSMPVAPNPRARNFTLEAPNRVWTGDITYIHPDRRRLTVPGHRAGPVQAKFDGHLTFK